jgi:hypothetical protein
MFLAVFGLSSGAQNLQYETEFLVVMHTPQPAYRWSQHIQQRS